MVVGIWDMVEIMCSRVKFMQKRREREDPKSGRVQDYFGIKSENLEEEPGRSGRIRVIAHSVVR